MNCCCAKPLFLHSSTTTTSATIIVAGALDERPAAGHFDAAYLAAQESALLRRAALPLAPHVKLTILPDARHFPGHDRLLLSPSPSPTPAATGLVRCEADDLPEQHAAGLVLGLEGGESVPQKEREHRRHFRAECVCECRNAEW